MIITGTKIEKTSVEVEITNEDLIKAIYRAIAEKYPSIDLINKELRDGCWHKKGEWYFEYEATHDELAIVTDVFNLEQHLL
jgi:hypothetical protein